MFNQEKIIKESVFSLLDELIPDTDLTNNLIRYSNYKTQEDKNWDVQEDLIQISKELFKEQKSLFLNQILDL